MSEPASVMTGAVLNLKGWRQTAIAGSLAKTNTRDSETLARWEREG